MDPARSLALAAATVLAIVVPLTRAQAPPVPAAPAPAAAAVVNIVDFMKFEPAVLTVAPGTTVTWANHDGSNHIIKFPDQQSPRLRHNASWGRAFPRPGEYAYQCGIHGAAMTGKIVVR